MRILEYAVEGDEIKKINNGGYSGLIKGSDETVNLKFTFSKDWNNSAKVVEFTTRDGKECAPQILINNMCNIPEEALNEYIFYVRVLGKTANGLLNTKKMAICQNGGSR